MTEDEETAHQIAVTALSLAFGELASDWQATRIWEGGTPRIEYWSRAMHAYEAPMRRRIDTRERVVLKALLECEPFWMIETNLLAVFGLPTTRPRLYHFLQQQKGDDHDPFTR